MGPWFSKASKERRARERQAESRELAVYKEKVMESRERITTQMLNFKAEIDKEMINARKIIEQERIKGRTIQNGMNLNTKIFVTHTKFLLCGIYFI